MDSAASAHYTLAVTSVVALIVLPLVLLYQGWTNYVYRARVTGEKIRSPADVLTAATHAVDVNAPGSSTTT